MQLLVADGEGQIADQLGGRLGDDTRWRLQVVASNRSARAHISSENVDCFILNPHLPTEDGAEDHDVETGMALFQEFIKDAPLTPVILVSGESLPIECVDRLLAEAQLARHGYFSSKFRAVSMCPADDIDGVCKKTDEFAKALDDLDEIEISSGANFVPLSSNLKRVLRQFSDRFGGSHCRIKKLAGGLSGSRVYSLKVEDNHGAQRVLAVGKIDSLDAIIDEIDKYECEVTRLPHDVYAPMVGRALVGSSEDAGVFYRLLDEDNRTLFDVVESNDLHAAEVVNSLRQRLATWTDGFQMQPMTVREVRQSMLNDDWVAEIVTEYGLEWVNRYEDLRLNVPISTVHGDLHGANILVSDANHPKLIDFGDVGSKPCMIDSLTLEFSLFTHPQFSGKTRWLPDLQNSEWRDLDAYVRNSPYQEFIRACRDWAFARGGDQAVFAGAYSYLMRQLKYKDTDKQLILSLLNSIKNSQAN